MAPQAARGRPPASSREMLQDAAFELFLENSYAGTTVEEIAQRAGVSRNTFFNYFPTKSDVFWVELDEALEQLAGTLRESAARDSPLRTVLQAILAVGREFGTDRVPFALTQHELVGSVHELQASALARFTRQARIIAGYLGTSGLDPLTAQAAGYAALGAAIAGVQSWAAAGTGRGDLEPYLRAAVEPVIRGYENSPAESRAT
uniref:TetR family transcriptional regulator n=1 Tax=Terrimesophilobacter sp. TaxID=2906435 RepID=UPI002F9588D6